MAVVNAGVSVPDRWFKHHGKWCSKDVYIKNKLDLVCLSIDTILPIPGLETDHVLPFMQQLNARAVRISVSHT